MSQGPEHHGPEDADEVVRRLRDERPQVGALELDGIKTRAMARAMVSPGGRALRSRILVALLSLALMGAGTGGVIAAGGGGSVHGKSAAEKEYKPGCGNGDKNHDHTGPPGRPDKDCKDGGDHGHHNDGDEDGHGHDRDND